MPLTRADKKKWGEFGVEVKSVCFDKIQRPSALHWHVSAQCHHTYSFEKRVTTKKKLRQISVISSAIPKYIHNNFAYEKNIRSSLQRSISNIHSNNKKKMLRLFEWSFGGHWQCNFVFVLTHQYIMIELLGETPSIWRFGVSGMWCTIEK